ncbi:MAG TPA: RluA family pseudouridine synthase [Chitinivibrionales bacterium]|nr:RluA family pseudouridine synthase [Chitinivibrionales bacterium]
MVTITISLNDANQRLDRFLRRRLSLRTLSDIYRMIRTGFARVNGKKVKENYRLRQGDTIELRMDEAELSPEKQENQQALADLSRTEFYRRNLKIVFEDDGLIACDKPPHLVVHPGTGHDGHATLIDLVKSYMLAKGKRDADPVLVHRLDRDTSGIILVAKNKAVVRKLHDLLRGRALIKKYLAICHNGPPQQQGFVEADLVKTLERNQGTKMRVGEKGLYSRTEYKVAKRGQGLSKLELTIVTGRTHQIRVHMAHIGCPVVGDVRYGDPAADADVFRRTGAPRRLYLHAGIISFVHPADGKRLTLTVPEPEEFSAIMKSAHC